MGLPGALKVLKTREFRCSDFALLRNPLPAGVLTEPRNIALVVACVPMEAYNVAAVSCS